METTIYLPTNFATVNDVKAANKKIGHKWFDEGSMNFFNSQVTGTDKLINKRFFISSEQFVPSSGKPEPRMYTIRVAKPTGEVETVGDFQKFETRELAIAAAHKIVTSDKA